MFDTPIDRRGTGCAKWDKMQELYGVCPSDGLAMWVADMDFRPPDVIQEVLQNKIDHGIYGYNGADGGYREAICWWMRERHQWSIEPEWIFSTHGLVNGTGMCVDTFTQAGDGIVLFTPVYHAFFKVISASKRKIVECPLALENGKYVFDFAHYDTLMTGNERMLILCSPHNPGGRVWSEKELHDVADFAKRHDLIIVSDEIHHDLIYPGHKHTIFSKVDPSVDERTIIMSATTKTFNIAGSHTGNVIIKDDKLRHTFAERMMALGMSPNGFGTLMSEAAYSPAGAQWVDELMRYLDGNRTIFDEALHSIPGLKSMPLEGTYLCWVDFSDTGMSKAELLNRVQSTAKIATNHGETFGKGGAHRLRFNIATQRNNVTEAASRLREAFADLQ